MQTFYLDLDLGNRFGVAFDYRGLSKALARALGHFDGGVVSQKIEDEWKNFIVSGDKIIWRTDAGSNALRQQMVGGMPLPDILRRHVPFGVLLPLQANHANPASGLHLFMEFMRKSQDAILPAWANYICRFSVRDSEAKEISTTQTHSKLISNVLAEISFPDGTPLTDDPGIVWRALANIAHNSKDKAVVERIAEGISHGASSCSGICFSVDTGLSLKADIPGFHARKHDAIHLGFTKGTEPLFYFGQNREQGISCRKCLPPLEQFAVIDNMSLATLADIADEEDWTFEKEDGTPVPFGRLRYYLEHTFEKIHLDHEAGLDRNHPEIVYAPNGNAAVFCTGLLHRDSGVYLYAYCSEPHNKTGVFQKVEWVFQFRQKINGEFKYTAHPLLAPLDTQNGSTKNHGLPYPVNWVNNPELLVVPYHSLTLKNVTINYRHLFKNRLRFKSVLSDIGLGMESTDQGVPSPNQLKRLQTFIEAAWPQTRKMVQANYKMAVPVWYDSQISVLLPLFLDKNNPLTPTIALVLSKDRHSTPEHPRFFIPTCLTLEMARNNARVIARMDDTWLAQATPSEIYRHTESAICAERQEERKRLLREVLDAAKAVMEFDSRKPQDECREPKETATQSGPWSLGTILPSLNNFGQ